jgi:stage II sporulation protein M
MEEIFMKKYLSGNIIAFICEKFSILITVLFCFFAGISIGVFIETLLSTENKDSIQIFLDTHLFFEQLPGNDLTHVFLESAAINLTLLLIIALGGLTIIGFPAALLVLIYKGATLGFSAALLIETLDFKGLIMVFFTLVPQNLILIPIFLAATMASLSLAFSVLSNKPSNIKKSLTKHAGNYIAFFLLLSVFVLGGCLIESFICPFLQRLIG